jgi:acetamidase/formamidase
VLDASGRIEHHGARNAVALRVVPGDTVRVRGARGGALPPVFVEGAYRGDVLVVRILSVRPAGARATMSSALDVNWLTPDRVRSIPPTPFTPATWTLDTIAGVARLDRPHGRLGALSVPLRLHIGMIAVAPRGNAIVDAGEEGAHGGNLDYNALGAGMTVYLPVNHEGALLSVGGDVHAAQGDGELAQLGLEVQSDIEYTVDVREGGAIPWIRAADASHLMAFGSSEDLNISLKLALSHLMEWLETDYGLAPPEVAVLLGSAIELDIANVFGQQRTIVAKVATHLLPAPLSKRHQ